jgi:hexosaminidase
VQSEDRTATPGLAYKTPHASTLRRVYEADPFEGLPSDAAEGSGSTARGRFLGVQANAWSEYLRDPRRLDYMLFPRLLAVAETGWLGAEKPGWEDFRSRLEGQRRILDRLAVNYCPIEFEVL